MKNIVKIVVDLFAIVGAIAGIVSTYIAFVALENESEVKEVTGFKKLQVAAASVIAPEGYFVRAAEVLVVPENSFFALKPNTSIQLTRNSRVPLTVQSVDEKKRVHLKINGIYHTMNVGDKKSLNNTKCSLWLYSVENVELSFELRCA